MITGESFAWDICYLETAIGIRVYLLLLSWKLAACAMIGHNDNYLIAGNRRYHYIMVSLLVAI